MWTTCGGTQSTRVGGVGWWERGRERRWRACACVPGAQGNLGAVPATTLASARSPASTLAFLRTPAGFTAASPVVQWFWELVREMDKQDLALLVQFVTGACRGSNDAAVHGCSCLGESFRFAAWHAPRKTPPGLPRPHAFLCPALCVLQAPPRCRWTGSRRCKGCMAPRSSRYTRPTAPPSACPRVGVVLCSLPARPHRFWLLLQGATAASACFTPAIIIRLPHSFILSPILSPPCTLCPACVCAAHTCFNQLDLIEYESKGQLRWARLYGMPVALWAAAALADLSLTHPAAVCVQGAPPHCHPRGLRGLWLW